MPAEKSSRSCSKAWRIPKSPTTIGTSSSPSLGCVQSLAHKGRKKKTHFAQGEKRRYTLLRAGRGNLPFFLQCTTFLSQKTFVFLPIRIPQYFNYPPSRSPFTTLFYIALYYNVPTIFIYNFTVYFLIILLLLYFILYYIIIYSYTLKKI